MKLFHKRFTRKVLDAIEMVKLGVLDRLAERYKGIYGQETGNALAAAVVSHLFCEQPADPIAREFLTVNKDVVERELSNLQYDDQVCKIVTQTLRIKASLSAERGGDMIKSLREHMDKLMELSIIIPSVYTPTPNSFLQIAEAFYHSK